MTTGLQQTIKQQDFKSRQRQMYVDVAESCYQSRVFNVAEKIKEWITRSATQLVTNSRKKECTSHCYRGMCNMFYALLILIISFLARFS